MVKKLLLSLGIALLLTTYTALAQDEKLEPFVQSDFNVLTGDVQRPNGIYWHDGFLYTGCAGDWTVYRIHDQTGETLTYIFGLKNVHMLYVESDADGGTDVWAVDFQDNKFVVINPQDQRGLFPIREGLQNPWGLTPSATDDTFFMTEWGSDNLLNISRDGVIRVVSSGFDDPSGVAATADSLYVANNGSARRAVEWIDITPGGEPTPQPLATGLQNVTNLVMGPDQKLYIAYALGTRGVVGRIDPEACKAQGSCANVDVELVVWTELPAPLAGLTITPDMRLFVHTMFGTEIYWLDLKQQRTAVGASS
jgi:hypothetical protein